MQEISQIVKSAIQLLSSDKDISELFSSEMEDLRKAESFAKAEKFRIGVIGVTSSGKSTLINSLLTEDLLPSKAVPSSCRLVTCYHSKERRCIVRFEDGHQIELKGKDLNQDTLSRYADETMNSHNHERVLELELYSPTLPLDQDTVLVDSPGLDAFGYDNHEKLTMANLLPTVDMCILVSTCKSVSDDKLCSTLNSIENMSVGEMPIVLVQNMIDAIMPSIDGTKSRDDVAKDHLRRIKRVVDRSEIKNKKLVRIVQYSAIWARLGQSATDSKERNSYLEKSNYGQLITAVHESLEYLRPRAQYKRLGKIKNKINEINDSLSDLMSKPSNSQVVQNSSPFKYETTSRKLEQCRGYFSETENSNSECLGRLGSLKDVIKNKDSFDEQYLDRTRDSLSEITSGITTSINQMYRQIKEVAEELGIVFKDMAVSAALTKVLPGLSMTTTKYRTKQKGLFAGIKRLFSSKESDSGYDVEYVSVVDVEATRESLANHVDDLEDMVRTQIESFQSTCKSYIDTIEKTIGAKRQEYEHRKQAAIQQNSDIGLIRNGLRTLADSIKLDDKADYKNVDLVGALDDSLELEEIPMLSYSIYEIARNIKNRLHCNLYSLAVGNEPSSCIIGWDKLSESHFIFSSLGIDLRTEDIKRGSNILSDTSNLVHCDGSLALHQLPDSRNYVFLLNGIQPGASAKEFSRVLSAYPLNPQSRCIVVLQDFQEIINSGDITDALHSIKDYLSTILSRDFTLLVYHDNPVYNMVLLDLQREKQMSQTREVKLMGELRQGFGYLMDEQSVYVIRQIIKAYN